MNIVKQKLNIVQVLLQFLSLIFIVTAWFCSKQKYAINNVKKFLYCLNLIYRRENKTFNI